MSKIFYFLLIAFITSCSSSPEIENLEMEKPISGPIQPIEKIQNLNAALVALGKDYFEDRSLSSDNTISCSSCHDLTSGGDDGLTFSKGVNNQMGDFNTPTVLNSVFNFKQFWDGRAKDLAEQIDSPITNHKEMNSNWNDVIAKLTKNKSYVKRTRKIFDDAINRKTITAAIVEFEKSLVTPSRFDKFLLGDDYAITELEKAGYKKFLDYGCVSCHQGKNIGGNMFQKMGVFEDYFDEAKKTKQSDYGRYNITGKSDDKYYFKVPSLRNVENTAPYFHDGSIKTLNEAIEIMARVQVGKELTEVDLTELSAFLKCLTGE